MGFSCRLDVFQISQQRQALFVACNFSIMKITPFLLLLLFVSGCDDHINYFIPDGFQYPDNKIEKGKTFVYQNNSTQERTFKDLRTLDMDGQHFQTLKSYDSNSVSDSVKLLNGKSFETFNFFMNKGRNPIKAENLKDTILNNGQKLGIHLTERKYQTEQIQYLTTSQEQYLKDTTIIWENSKLLCLVTQANAKIEIKVKADTSINHLTKVVSNFYYAKDIGLIKYSIQFTDQNGKDNYGLWELKSIKNIVN